MIIAVDTIWTGFSGLVLIILLAWFLVRAFGGRR